MAGGHVLARHMHPLATPPVVIVLPNGEDACVAVAILGVNQQLNPRHSV